MIEKRKLGDRIKLSLEQSEYYGVVYNVAADHPKESFGKVIKPVFPKGMPVLRAIGHAKCGFNIFWRFRITYMQETECPEVIRHFWSGHAPRHVSERYTKLRDERQFRLEGRRRWGWDLNYSPVLDDLGNRDSFQKSPKS